MICYRKLKMDDLPVFISLRIRQLIEEGAREDADLRPALMDYYLRHLADGTFVSWLALDGEKIVGTSGMSFVEKPPYFSCPTGRIGLLSSMYTDPAYRRRVRRIDGARRPYPAPRPSPGRTAATGRFFRGRTAAPRRPALSSVLPPFG